jgi:hypothetical protein
LHKIFEPFGPIVELVLLRDKFVAPTPFYQGPPQHRGTSLFIADPHKRGNSKVTMNENE